MNVIPEKGGQFQDHRPRMEPLKLTAGGGKSGKGNRNLSLTAQHARNFLDCMRSRAAAPLRRGDRPSLDDLCQPGQHRPGRRRAIGMGRRARSGHQLSEGQRAVALRVSQAVVVGLTRTPLPPGEGQGEGRPGAARKNVPSPAGRLRARAVRQRAKRSPRPPGEGRSGAHKRSPRPPGEGQGEGRSAARTKGPLARRERARVRAVRERLSVLLLRRLAVNVNGRGTSVCRTSGSKRE